MHCPGCGQQQISKETKFCSRCGLPLTLVSEVLVHGGYLPQLAEIERASGTIFSRRNGVLFSLFWLIFWLLIMAVVFGGIFRISILGELFSVMGIFGGLLIFLFSLFFLKRGPKDVASVPYMQQSTSGLYSQSILALPSQPASAYAQPDAKMRYETGDVIPRSVTEDTTQLLMDEEHHSQATLRCSACSTTYTDPSLRYCLVDGAALTDLSLDQETVVRSTNDLLTPRTQPGRQKSG